MSSIVDTYVGAVHARDADALAALFTPDGVLRHPAGTFTGPDEIAGFYRDVVIAGQARITVGAVLAGDGIVMAELAATSDLAPDAEATHAVDVFRLGPDGRIAALEIYYR